jgi:Chaperone of endosialidase
MSSLNAVVGGLISSADDTAKLEVLTNGALALTVTATQDVVTEKQLATKGALRQIQLDKNEQISFEGGFAIVGRAIDTNDPYGSIQFYNKALFLSGTVQGFNEPNYKVFVTGANAGLQFENVGAGVNAVATGWTGTEIQFRVDSLLLPAGTLSDKTLKENIVNDTDNALDKVNALQPVRFNFKENGVFTNSQTKLGFIAQDVQAVIPEAVNSATKEANALLGIEEMPMIAVLTKAVQELSVQVKELQDEVKALKGVA